MRILSLEAKNIFSIGHIKLKLESLGLTLVTGHSYDEGSSNGAGKSSVANKAILWTLYGQTAGGLKADNVLNRHGKRKGTSQIEFIGTDDAKYKIVRARPAKLTLFKDGEDVSAKTAKDTQDMIDKALGMDFRTFVQTAFFGQGRLMSYASLTPKEQKAVLEEILPMEEIDRWATYAEQEAKKLKADHDRWERAVITTQATANTLRDQLERQELAAKAWHSTQQDKIIGVQQKIETLEQEFTHWLQVLSVQNQHTKTADELNLEREANEKEHARIKPERDKSNELYLQARRVEDQWKNRRDSLSREIKQLVESSFCITCKRPYDDTSKETVELKLKDLRETETSARETWHNACKATTYYMNETSKLQGVLDALTVEHRRIYDDLQIRADLDNKKEYTVTSYQSHIKGLQNKIEEIRQQTNPHTETINSIRFELQKIKESVIQAHTKLGLFNSEYEHLTFWRDVYAKELKLKLFESCCAFLDTRTATHLKGLRNEQIHVEFSTIKRLASGESRDEFAVNAWSETGGTGFDSLSGGEQQMASFAIGLALSDLASSRAKVGSHLLILDEPFSQLDARNSEAIVDYLTKDLGANVDTVLLISNEDVLKGLIPNRIHVTKRNGITEVSDA